MLVHLIVLAASLGLAFAGYALLHRSLGWVDLFARAVGLTEMPFVEKLALEDIQNELYQLTDGSFVAGWEFQPIDTEMRSEEEVARARPAPAG